MSELVTKWPSLCSFCSHPAQYTCDHLEIIPIWRCPSNLAGDPEHEHHNYTYTRHCFASMCDLHCVEMAENRHYCLVHRPVPPEEAIIVVHKIRKQLREGRRNWRKNKAKAIP